MLERLRFAGLPFVTPTTLSEVTDRSAAFTGGSGAVVVSGRRSVLAEPDGGSSVVLTVDVRLRGALTPLTALLAPGYRRRHRADADALAALLAQPASTASRSAAPASSA